MSRERIYHARNRAMFCAFLPLLKGCLAIHSMVLNPRIGRDPRTQRFPLGLRFFGVSFVAFVRYSGSVEKMISISSSRGRSCSQGASRHEQDRTILGFYNNHWPVNIQHITPSVSVVNETLYL
jgi:hypothetical protein